MKLQTLRVKNFKALQDINLQNLPEFAVFVGPNGSGKSSVFKVLQFLKNCLKNNVREAVRLEGDFKELVTREHDEENIEIELQVYMDIAGVQRLVTYILHIGLVQQESTQRPVVKREILRYKRGESGKPFHFLDFSLGKGYAINNEEDFNTPDKDLQREEQQLEPNLLAINGLGQFKRFKAANALRELLEGWHISDFHISEARGRKEAGAVEHLSPSGDNLPLMAQYLYEDHEVAWNRVLNAMQRRIPGIAKVEAKPTEDGYLMLRFEDKAFRTPFLDRFVSDGTIKMLAYLVLLNDPKPHPLLCVEEPENQLYPHLLRELAEEFRLYAQKSTGRQVFVTSHSPDFINALEPQELYWLEKTSGITRIHRASENSQIVALYNEGDHLGELWRQQLFQGIRL
jgi:predicted ATPase